MITGVNLGNWLVLEKWMSPDLFEPTTAEDETGLCQQLDHEIKRERFRTHRNAFVTERDFAYLAGLGVKAVRIPVPYFVFGDVEPFVGCIEYVDRAFEWAAAHGLKIMLDLHTVPGSQNGFDNGGLCGVCRWHRSPDDVEFVLALLERLTSRYRGHPAFWAIEVLNEPISEELWTTLTGRESVVIADWPADSGFRDPAAEAEIAEVQRVVTEVRRFRSDQGLQPGQRVPARLTLDGTLLAPHEDAIRQLLRLQPEGEGTRLVLIDQLQASAAARNAAGWEDCLDRLAGLPGEKDAWPRRFAAYSAAFEPVIGPQEGPPAGYKGDS